MPIYEYRCTSCGTLTEVIQRMNDDPLRTCTSCAGRLEKLLSRTSFQLAGGGWASSGYARAAGSNGKGEAADGAAAKGSDGQSPQSAPPSGGSGGCGAGCGCH